MLLAASLTAVALCSPSSPSRSLYATTAPLTTGTLPVADGASLYYEVHGSLRAPPALFLHGGPGAGCFRRHAGFFDPRRWSVVLFDQRGCGRSAMRGINAGVTSPLLLISYTTSICTYYLKCHFWV